MDDLTPPLADADFAELEQRFLANLDAFWHGLVELRNVASVQPDFFHGKDAHWLLDPATNVSVMKASVQRYGFVEVDSKGERRLMGLPFALVSTKDLASPMRSEVIPTGLVERDPALIAIAYKGEYGFVRYVVSSHSDQRFRQFDTTGRFKV